MPHIQVLPAIPSFGEKLAGALGTAASKAGTASVERHKMIKDKESDSEIIRQYEADPNKSAMKTIDYFYKLSPRGQAALAPLFGNVVKENAKTQELTGLRDKYGPRPMQGGMEPQSTAPPVAYASPQSAAPIVQGGAQSFMPAIMENGAGQNPQVPMGAQMQMQQQMPPQPQQPQMPGHPNTSEEKPYDPYDASTWSDADLVRESGFKGQRGEVGVRANIAEEELKRRQSQRVIDVKKGNKLIDKNEPLLSEHANKLQALEAEDMRFQRLEHLFKDNKKFPNAFTAALFSSEGQLRPLASALLSPEAQEALKLIVDSTSDIKDTYGARVTNFDLQTYMKKLPSLLNSPKGRERVLRDLRIINEMNRIRENGILEIFDEAGGPDKIPYSTAERLYQKKYGSEIKNLQKEFVNPSVKNFNGKPNAATYKGKKIKDDKTGEIFISNGEEWEPYKGEK